MDSIFSAARAFASESGSWFSALVCARVCVHIVLSLVETTLGGKGEGKEMLWYGMVWYVRQYTATLNCVE